MILITGATGGYGRAVIDYLLRNGIRKAQLAVLARNPDKADELKSKGIHVLAGDYDDYPSLVNAFEEINKLLFVPGRDLDKRPVQNENVIKAAREAGVRHVIYASIECRNGSPASPLWLLAEAHLLTERLLKESGLTYTVLRNNLYLDFLPDFIGQNVLQTGAIYLPAGNGKVSAALRSDMAGAAAAVLAAAGHENKTYSITGTEAFSYTNVAELLSVLTGQTIRYVSPAPEEYAETLKQAGVPERVANISMGFALAQAQGDLDVVSDDLVRLIRKTPVSWKDFLKHRYTCL